MNILSRFIENAKKLKATVIFPEGDEERTLQAAVRLADEGVGNVILLAPKKSTIEAAARKKRLDLGKLALMVPERDALNSDVVVRFKKHRMAKGSTEEEAEKQVLDPLNFAALYVASGRADAAVAGARADTADVLRAGIYGIGTSTGVRLVSSFFVMVPPADHPVCKAPVLYADCAVNPVPSARGLKDIAAASVLSFKCLFPGETARVAFLSYSTRGSADQLALKKIREAADMTRFHFADDPQVAVDGELQFDAAAVESVAKIKCPGSPVGGKANIFIFPDLNSGNIGYKITERYGQFKAVGPVIQGLAKPFSDLSRGCSVDDIYYVTAITILRKTGCL